MCSKSNSKINLRSVFILLCIQFLAFLVYAQPKPNIRYVVISDADDTIAVSHILQRDLGKILPITTIGHALNPLDAFIGAAELYQILAKSGVTFEYVSGMPKLVNALSPGGLTTFLDLNSFPGDLDRNVHLKGMFDGETYDFKVEKITEIVDRNYKENPGVKFIYIFVGDNGEKDVAVYQTMSKYISEKFNENEAKVGATFIHKLYSGEPALDLVQGQKPYFTFADLAIELSKTFPNLLSQSDSEDVTKLVIEALRSDEVSLDSERNRALPHWNELTKSDLENFFKIIDSSGINAQMKDFIKELVSHRVGVLYSSQLGSCGTVF